MRYIPLVLVVLASCNPQPKPENTPAVPEAASFTAENAKELIPEAAGVPSVEFQRVVSSRIASNKLADHNANGHSLTAALSHFRWVNGPQPPTSFRFLWGGKEAPINPLKLVSVILGPKDKDGEYRKYASMIHPEYITDCTAQVDGDTASGTVKFKVEDVYEGAVDYTARKKDGGWRIEEFRLPDHKITVALGTDGKWVKK